MKHRYFFLNELVPETFTFSSLESIDMFTPKPDVSEDITRILGFKDLSWQTQQKKQAGVINCMEKNSATVIIQANTMAIDLSTFITTIYPISYKVTPSPNS